jgi:hypothetical protein
LESTSATAAAAAAGDPGLRAAHPQVQRGLLWNQHLLLLPLLLQAIQDFRQRILKYNEVYEPIDDRRLHYIKLIDM